MYPLKLVEIDGIMPGGSTKPVNIIALDGDDIPCKFVMKVYTKKNIIENVSVAKEIVCLEIARQFNLTCPEYGIINFEHTELVQLFDKSKFSNLDTGYKFCSKFVEQTVIFNPNVTNSFLKDYEVANIFAFDFLIYNVDRGGDHNKPNLLINDTDLILIDHELTFPFVGKHFRDINYEDFLRNYQFQKHTLIRYLQSLKKKEGLFDEFIEMLKNLNIRTLSHTFDEMNKFDIPYMDRDDFLHYFAWAKNNTATFERYLKGMIK